MRSRRAARQAPPAARPGHAAFALGLLLTGVAAGAAAQPAGGLSGDIRTGLRETAAERLAALRASIQPRRGGILGLMGHTMIPDGSANAVQVDRTTSSGDEGDTALTLSQFGFGFTLSESVPLYLEIYAGYARYDPRGVFVVEETQRTPARWNNFTGTLGVGYDIRLSDTLWLRPIVNVAAGYAAPDTALLAGLIGRRRGTDRGVLDDLHVRAAGVGGALTLAYYDYRPEGDLEAELRLSQLDLETSSDSIAAAQGRSTSRTIGLWTRYRWPTGWEAFGRPVRWVLDNSFSLYLGDQEPAVTFGWAAKLGGGIEFDTGRWEFGAFGLNMERVRFVGRYFIGDGGVTGVSFGLGLSL